MPLPMYISPSYMPTPMYMTKALMKKADSYIAIAGSGVNHGACMYRCILICCKTLATWMYVYGMNFTSIGGERCGHESGCAGLQAAM